MNLDQHTLDVARDAIREGRLDVVAGIINDQPKGALLGEQLHAATTLARALGVSHITVCPFETSVHIALAVNAPADVDRVFEDLVASGAVASKPPFEFKGDKITWRQSVVDLGTLHITVTGPHRKWTRAEKRKQNVERKRLVAYPGAPDEEGAPF